MRSGTFDFALHLCRRSRPFRPYTVELMTGERFIVRHPEALRFRRQFAILVEPDGLRRFFDAESVCQVIEAEVPPRP
jgi:hypothetical protein